MGTTRILSTMMSGVHSVPASPPCQTKNVNPVSIVLSKDTSQGVPSYVLLKSDKLSETVVHLPPVSYEPLFAQGIQSPRGNLVSLK